MRQITVVPSKRIDSQQLRIELIAAGVPLLPSTELAPLHIQDTGDGILLLIDGDTDEWDLVAQQVLMAHTAPEPLTRAQERRLIAKEALRARGQEPASVAHLVSRRRAFRQEQATREAHNTLLAAMVGRFPALAGVLGAPLPTWSWAEELVRMAREIDEELT